jgi:hypothetical protein
MLTYCTGLDVEHFLQLDDAAKSEITALAERISVLKGSIESIGGKLTNIMSAIESGANTFPQFLERARQLEQERTHLEFELQSAQKKYERTASMKVDIAAVRATIDDLVSRMNALTGDDLYDLRAELSQQIKRLIGRIMIYPGGYMEKPAYIAALREHLQTKGYSPEDIDGHVTAKYNVTPNPSTRFFIAASRTGSIRMIQPSAENPEVLHFNTPDADVAANISTHVESIGVLTHVLKNRLKDVQ